MADEEGEIVTTEVEGVVLKTMKAKLEHLEEEGKEPYTIYRVLPSVRDGHSEDYDPKIISIGPLHAGKKILEPMEQLKWRYLQDLLSRCRHGQDMLAKYINKVTELEVRARKRYADAVELDSDAFVQVMVLDACFIIEWLIQWRYGPKRRYKVDQVKWSLPLLRNDLLLLENQIPFFIVQSLFDLSNIPGILDLEKLAVDYVTRGKSQSVPATVPENIHHLLHLFYLSFLPTSSQSIMTAPSCGHLVMSTIKKIGSLASGSFFWLLSSFVYCRPPLKCLEFHDSADEERLRAPRMIPTATELEESGVEFKRKKANSSLDITFRDGVMEIPLLSVEDNTAPKFRNLIAFEQCCPTPGSHFTSYASFLDNLINTPRDVAILRKCGIIENKLGQDEEVADLFNSLCKGTYLHYETHFFANLFKDVNQYCEVDRHRWRARLVHDYFGTPWSTISVIAAIFLLILTVTQTFFAVYAYYQPPEQS